VPGDSGGTRMARALVMDEASAFPGLSCIGKAPESL